VQSWDLKTIEAPDGTRSPAVLETADGARAIVIRLAPGQELGDHQVHERAWLVCPRAHGLPSRTRRISCGGERRPRGEGKHQA
jgi:hypothetical protein